MDAVTGKRDAVADFMRAKPRGKKAPTVLPWVEKYRPRTIDEVAHQTEVVQTLKASLQSGNLPHLLFYGPPGTGKTSTILAIARDLFGHEYFRSRVQELNASDERGISVIREKVKTFAQAAASEIPVKGGHTIPPYKLIILDEADSLTQDAQGALRRIMETYSRVTRFCIICNYVSRIIEPVASRCAKFRFRSLEPEVMLSRLRYISDQEEVKIDDTVLLELSKLSEGDLRRAITLLQSATRLHGKELSSNAIVDVAAVIPSSVCEALMAACRSGSFDTVQKAVQSVTASGYSAAQVFSQLNELIVSADKITDQQKVLKHSYAHLCERKVAIGWAIAEADKALVDGADEFLQILRVFSVIMKQLQVPLS